jgi:hypothetical protein
MFAERRYPACLRPLLALLFHEAHARANFQAVEAGLADAVSMKIYLATIDAFQEAATILGQKLLHDARRVFIVNLHLAVHLPDLVLQVPDGSVEGVMQREFEALESLVQMRGALNCDFALVWQAEVYMNVVKPAGMMAVARRFHDDTASGKPTIAILKTLDLRDDLITKCFGRLHSLKVYLRLRLHGLLLWAGSVWRLPFSD